MHKSAGAKDGGGARNSAAGVGGHPRAFPTLFPPGDFCSEPQRAPGAGGAPHPRPPGTWPARGQAALAWGRGRLPRALKKSRPGGKGAGRHKGPARSAYQRLQGRCPQPREQRRPLASDQRNPVFVSATFSLKAACVLEAGRRSTFPTLLSGWFVRGWDGAGERPAVPTSPSSAELTPGREGRGCAVSRWPTRGPRPAGLLLRARAKYEARCLVWSGQGDLRPSRAVGPGLCSQAARAPRRHRGDPEPPLYKYFSKLHGNVPSPRAPGWVPVPPRQEPL